MKISFPWSLDPEQLFTHYRIRKDHGLDDQQVEEQLRQYGENTVREEKRTNKFMLLLLQFKNPMVYMLVTATVVALILGEMIDAVAILSILLLNAVIGFIQESRASDAIAALKKLSVPDTRVIRSGQIHSIPSVNVVPGDILHLEAGDFISADARLYEAHQLTANEAPLTGESLPVEKSTPPIQEQTALADRKNMLHSGTSVTNGSAKAIVIATGMKTEIGKIAELIQNTEVVETPLQERLNKVTKNLIYLGLLVILIVIILRMTEGESWFTILMSAISLAVAAIPEGLPTVVTLALTFAVKRMTRRNAIVRYMSAVETLGSTDVICTDKTGTLTTGFMQVKDVFIPKEEHELHFLEAMVLCNNASLDHEGSGDMTERALLQYAKDKGLDLPAIKRSYPRTHEWSFDSDRKRMSVSVETPEGVKVLTKGAPEATLPRCRLSKEESFVIEEMIRKLTGHGQRILAVAEKRGSLEKEADALERDLDFLGLVALADPPRKETIPAIRECQRAGIKIMMITGDHPATAKAIAHELGILIPGKFDGVLTGHELESLSVEQLRSRVETTAVYARVSPSHKLKIVEALQENGHVVSMTGDGVNDAPALKKAQIGIAMGKGGTEVARQASSIILTDDNFSTIVSAVEEGRAIYGNIKRTVQFLLTTNLSEILIVLGASFLKLPTPFDPVGLLWINLVTDGLPSLALAAEPLDKDILKESDRPSPSSFFDKAFVRDLVITGLLMTALCLGIYYYLFQDQGIVKARSYIFTLLVSMILLISFAYRSESKSFIRLKPNFFHLLSVVVPLFLQVWILHIPFFQSLFRIEALSVGEISFILFLSIIPLLIVDLLKWKRKK